MVQIPSYETLQNLAINKKRTSLNQSNTFHKYSTVSSCHFGREHVPWWMGPLAPIIFRFPFFSHLFAPCYFQDYGGSKVEFAWFSFRLRFPKVVRTMIRSYSPQVDSQSVAVFTFKSQRWLTEKKLRPRETFMTMPWQNPIRYHNTFFRKTSQFKISSVFVTRPTSCVV